MRPLRYGLKAFREDQYVDPGWYQERTKDRRADSFLPDAGSRNIDIDQFCDFSPFSLDAAGTS